LGVNVFKGEEVWRCSVSWRRERTQ